jgi:excinuclease UvrABC ATPase subunit
MIFIDFFLRVSVHIVDAVLGFSDGQKFHICIDLVIEDDQRDFSLVSKQVTDMGFVRFQIGHELYSVADNRE